MSASLNQMLLAVWRQSDRESPWGRRLLALFGAAALAVALWLMPQPQDRLILLATVLAAALMTAWLAITGSLLEQNHPHAARFVPGHLQCLRRAALLSWALLTPAAALLQWAALRHLLSLPAVLLGGAALLVYMAWALRWWPLWLLPVLGPSAFGVFELKRRLAPLWAWAFETWQALPWSLTGFGLLALGWVLSRLFRNGDAAHRAAYASSSRLRQASRDAMLGKTGAQAFGRPGELLAAPFRRATSAWLAFVLRRAGPSEASAMSRAEIVLHGNQHWLQQLLGMGVVAVVVLAGLALGVALAGPEVAEAWQRGSFGLAIGLASAGFNPCFTLPGMLWHSRREQALLALLPGMPQGRRLNRAIARRQLRHGLGAALPTSLLLAGLASAAANPALLCFVFTGLPMLLLCLLRPAATLEPPSAWSTLLPLLAHPVAGGVAFLLCDRLGVSLWLVAAVCAALSAGIAAWRWHQIDAAPAALPAGRLR